MKIEDLRARQVECQQNGESIVAKATAENRDLNEDERKEISAMNREFASLEEQIQLISTIQNNSAHLTQGAGRVTDPEPEPRQPENAVQPQPQQQLATRQQASQPNRTAGPLIMSNGYAGIHGKAGFKNFGEFALSVRNMTPQAGNQVDERIRTILNTPTIYGSESVGADGGVAVPPDFRSEIVTKVFGEESLINRTDLMTSSSNTITIPKDETTPWQSTGGIQAYWESEAGLITQSKPSLEELTIKLNKLTTLIPVTEELLEDAPGLSAYLSRKAPDKMTHKVNLGIMQGTGVGQPQGIIGSPATVSVAKETNQTADTVVFENIVKMWSRMYAPCRANAVWLINQTVEEQLLKMSIAVGTGGIPAYLPANGLSGQPYSTLMGRPVIATQACPAVGDKGDIVLADLSKYLTVQKVGGIRSETSIHLWFDYDMTAFRFILRVAGQPWWNAYITPAAGSAYLGAFVTLDERA